jgi:hypothetical protein
LITSCLTLGEPEKFKTLLLEEIAYLVDKKFSWESIQMMPIYERKFYINKWMIIDEKIKEAHKANAPKSTGSRKR